MIHGSVTAMTQLMVRCKILVPFFMHTNHKEPMMAQNAVEINGQNLPVREYEGTRVVTFDDVATVHQTEAKRIRDNFNNNRKHFTEGTDYFLIKGKKANLNFRQASKFTTQLNVFTESGYLMLVKSLTDDLSWQVQKLLVNNYFKVQEIKKVYAQKKPIVGLVRLYPLLEEMYKQIIYYRFEKGLTQYETALVLGVSRKVIYKKENELREAGISLPRQTHNQNKYQLSVLKALAGVE